MRILDGMYRLGYRFGYWLGCTITGLPKEYR